MLFIIMNSNIDKVDCVEYFSNFLSDNFSKKVYADIMKEVNFYQMKIQK